MDGRNIYIIFAGEGGNQKKNPKNKPNDEKIPSLTLYVFLNFKFRI